MVSIEALDIYALDQIKYPNYTEFLLTDNQPIISNFLMRLSNYIRHPSYFMRCSFTDAMHVTYLINQFIRKPHVQHRIYKILDDYANTDTTLFSFSKLTHQYIHRFKHIYSKTHDLYNSNHYEIKTNIEYTSILNLYILNQTYTKLGTYRLIQYLNSCY